MKTVNRLCVWMAMVGIALGGLTLGASATSTEGQQSVAVVSSQMTAGSFSWASGTTAQVAAFLFSPLKDDRDRHHKKQSVPEGGSALMYVTLAGLSCFGAMIIRSRMKAKRAA